MLLGKDWGWLQPAAKRKHRSVSPTLTSMWEVVAGVQETQSLDGSHRNPQTSKAVALNKLMVRPCIWRQHLFNSLNNRKVVYIEPLPQWYMVCLWYRKALSTYPATSFWSIMVFWLQDMLIQWRHIICDSNQSIPDLP